MKKQNLSVQGIQKLKSQNWKRSSLIYIAIATVVLYGAVNLGGQKSPSISKIISPSPSVAESSISPTPVYGGFAPCKATPDSASSGEIYVCKDFSVTLPEGWMELAGEFTNYDVGKSEGRDYSEELDAGKLKIGVRINKTNQSLDTFAKEYAKGSDILSFENMSLNGYQAIKESTANTYYPNQSTSTYFVQNPSGSSIATIYTVFGFYKNNIATFDQAASTFKFTQKIKNSDFNNLKSYEDNDFRIKFKYPADWGDVIVRHGAPAGKLLGFSKNYSIAFGAFIPGGFDRETTIYDFTNYTEDNNKYFWNWRGVKAKSTEQIKPIKIVNSINTKVLVVNNNSFDELKNYYDVGILNGQDQEGGSIAGLVNLKGKLYTGLIFMNNGKEKEDMFDQKPSPGQIPVEDFAKFLSTIEIF